eukprot:322982-Rhodomonas_salina.1
MFEPKPLPCIVCTSSSGVKFGLMTSKLTCNPLLAVCINRRVRILLRAGSTGSQLEPLASQKPVSSTPPGASRASPRILVSTALPWSLAEASEAESNMPSTTKEAAKTLFPKIGRPLFGHTPPDGH